MDWMQAKNKRIKERCCIPGAEMVENMQAHFLLYMLVTLSVEIFEDRRKNLHSWEEKNSSFQLILVYDVTKLHSMVMMVVRGAKTA